MYMDVSVSLSAFSAPAFAIGQKYQIVGYLKQNALDTVVHFNNEVFDLHRISTNILCKISFPTASGGISHGCYHLYVNATCKLFLYSLSNSFLCIFHCIKILLLCLLHFI